MADGNDVLIEGGRVYKAMLSGGEDSNFIVTAVGLNHVLFSDYPMIKFNGTYLEYCVTRKEFQCKFKPSSPNAA